MTDQPAWKPANTAPKGVPVTVRYEDGFEAQAVRVNDTGGWVVTSNRDLRGLRPIEWR
jgi:hypothetical protein